MVITVRLLRGGRESCTASPVCGILKQTKLLWEGPMATVNRLKGASRKRGNLVSRRWERADGLLAPFSCALKVHR